MEQHEIPKKPMRINSSTGYNNAMIRNISEKRDKIDKTINNRVKVQQAIFAD